MLHDLDALRQHSGEAVVAALIGLRPLVRAAKLKTGPFADAPYPGFEARHDRLLAAVPDDQHDAVRAAMLAPVLSLNTFYEPTAQEMADYKRYYEMMGGDLGGPPLPKPQLYLEGVSFEIRGSMLRKISKPLSGAFTPEPFPAHLKSAYGTGAVRYTRALVGDVLMSLMLFRERPGEFALSSFAEKDGKGARIEPWTMFNFPADWMQVTSEAELQDRLALLFESANLFCDCAAREGNPGMS